MSGQRGYRPPERSALALLAGELARALWRALAGLARIVRGQVVQHVGGPARARVVVLFGAVLALSGADAATVGAAAPQLEHALRIGNTEVGVLSSATLLVGALFVMPVGILVDRVSRVGLLAASIVLWSIASLASGLAGSYDTLLFTRLALGAVVATAGPAVASLTGDYFPAAERGRVYSYILAGEAAGSAVGFIVGGSLASAISWQAAFIVLAIPGFVLARSLWRTVPEPLRGGQSYLQPGALSLDEALSQANARAAWELEHTARTEVRAAELVGEAVRRSGAVADPALVLREDPRSMPLARAVRYILSIPTFALLVIGSSLGYFFFAGLQAFAILFMLDHYRTEQATAELVVALLLMGALVGTVIGGRLSDWLLHRGHVQTRVWMPALCYLGAAVLLVPGFSGSHLFPALWFDLGGAALISAANPPLDAARLDVMPAGLWGRAESTRSFVRSLAQALAPLLFGAIADLVAGIAPKPSLIGTHLSAAAISTGTGLEVSFLIMLSALAAAGIFLARARHTYARDVATAAASRRALPAQRLPGREAPPDLPHLDPPTTPVSPRRGERPLPVRPRFPPAPGDRRESGR
ncbi:MAG: MFS transporter [Acidobacteriota bacterium]|nr:MFS transporter [Acidobacteriota bacterium]